MAKRRATVAVAASHARDLRTPSTRRDGRRLLGRRWRRGRSRAWFTATVHHARFSSVALVDRSTHLAC